MLAALKILWRSWKRLTHGINRAIAAVLMTVTYVIALGPVALYFRLTGQQLTDRGPGDINRPSHWKPPAPDNDDIRRAQRPW
ncbi:MAG: hypothetical protein AAFV53_20175 [Myxococcota bacterium]